MSGPSDMDKLIDVLLKMVKAFNNISTSIDGVAHELSQLSSSVGDIGPEIGKLGCFGDAGVDSIDVHLSGDVSLDGSVDTS